MGRGSFSSARTFFLFVCPSCSFFFFLHVYTPIGLQVCCAAVVVFLLRLLKKHFDKQAASTTDLDGIENSRRVGTGEYEDELTESSMVADLGVFAPTNSAPVDVHVMEDWDFESIDRPQGHTRRKNPAHRGSPRKGMVRKYVRYSCRKRHTLLQHSHFLLQAHIYGPSSLKLDRCAVYGHVLV